MTYTNPDIATAVHTLTENILAGGISFCVEGMQMRTEAQRWYEMHWYPWVRRILRSLWISGFAAVAIAPTNAKKYCGIPVVLDLSMLIIEQSRTLTGRPKFYYYDPEQPLVKGRQVRLRGIRTYIHSPPDGAGKIRSKLSCLVHDIHMIRTLDLYRLQAENSRSDPLVAVEDAKPSRDHTDQEDSHALGTGMYSDLADHMDNKLSEMALQSISSEHNSRQPAQRRLWTDKLAESFTAVHNSASSSSAFNQDLQATLQAGEDGGARQRGNDGKNYEEEEEDTPRKEPQYLRIPRRKHLVHQVMAQAPTDAVFVRTTVSERVSSVFGIPPGLNGHRHGLTQQSNNTNSMLLFVHTLSEWRRTIVPLIQNMYDWMDCIENRRPYSNDSGGMNTGRRSNPPDSVGNDDDEEDDDDDDDDDDDENWEQPMTDDESTHPWNEENGLYTGWRSGGHTESKQGSNTPCEWMCTDENSGDEYEETHRDTTPSKSVVVSMPGSIPDSIIEQWHDKKFISDAGVYAHLSTKYSIRDEHLTSWNTPDASINHSEDNDDGNDDDCSDGDDQDDSSSDVDADMEDKIDNLDSTISDK
jgi:hypothetical protein